VRKRELVEWLKNNSSATDQTGAEAASIESGNLASSFILSQIASMSGRNQSTSVSPEASLAMDLKLDSIGRVELLSALEDHYQIEIDEASFTETTTLGEVEELVRERGQRPKERVYPRWQIRWPVTWIRIVLFYVLMLPLTRLMGRAKVTGRENLRDKRGPLLFVSNHIAMVDQSLIQSALPGRYQRMLAVAMEGEKLSAWRHPSTDTRPLARFIGWIKYILVVSLLNVFPLPRRSGFRRSFEFAGELMDRGYSVLVFPEGRRTPDGEMQQFMEGIGLLTGQLRTRVVPIRISGLYELTRRKGYFARSGEVRITIAEPITFRDDDSAAAITQELHRRVSSL
jgi:long-chain acyl-CoA synthetase